MVMLYRPNQNQFININSSLSRIGLQHVKECTVMQTEYIYDVGLFIHVVARGPIILHFVGGVRDLYYIFVLFDGIYFSKRDAL